MEWEVFGVPAAQKNKSFLEFPPGIFSLSTAYNYKIKYLNYANVWGEKAF